MEIFKLFGRILVDNTDAVDNIKDTEKKAEDAAKAFDEMAGQAGLMAGAVVAAAAAIVTAIGIKAVTAADEFRRSMNTLQAQTGASDEEMKKFGETAKRLYAENYGQSFEDIAKSMSEIARTTGLSGKELEATTKNAIALRDTFELGVNETARTANSLIKNFGITADQAYTLIAQGAQQGANKNGDLLDTLNEYSVQFSAMGLSAEEFTGVLIDGAKNGAFSIDKVGDAVKEFTIRSKDGSKASMNAFADLGFNADKMTKAFASGGDTARQAFQQVTTALAGVADPVQKNTIGVALFGTQFEDLEAEAITALSNIQSKTNQNADTLQKINDVKYDSFGEALKGLGRQLEISFFVPLGEKIMPKLTELIDWIQNNSGEIEKKLGGAVDTLAGLFNALADGLLFVIKNFKALSPLIAGVTGMIIAQFVIGTLIPMYQAWRIATASMTVAQAALNAVMALNPFTWVALAIGAVIAAIVALVVYWDEVKAAAKATWGWIASFFKTKIGMIVAVLGGPITIAMMIIANWKKVKAMAISIWDSIVSFFNGKIGKLVLLFSGPIGMGISIIKNWSLIKARAIEIWDAIVAKFLNVRDKIVGFFSSMKSSIKNAFSSLAEIIKKPLNAIIGGLNTFTNAYEKVINKIAGMINKIPRVKISVPGTSGFDFGLPKFPTIDIPDIPMLADGGTIKRAGSVIVGEEGPELLELPRAAQVTPLDKTSQSIVININDAKVFNERDGERLGELIVKSLKLKGIVPRGV